MIEITSDPLVFMRVLGSVISFFNQKIIMEALFQDSEVFVRERPTTATEQQDKIFYKEKAQEIIDNDWSNSQIERIIIDLEDLYPFRDSGFEMAKELDGLSSKGSYKINSEFVEFLEDLSSEYSDIIDENVKAWVKAIQPMPLYKKGDKIKLTLPVMRTPDYAAGKEFYIISIHEKDAKYVFHPVENNNGGTLLPYERLETCSVLL